MDHFWSSLYTTIAILCVFYGNSVYSVILRKICQQVTSFDAVCHDGDILYILSAQPCTSKTSVSVTLINMKNATFYVHHPFDGDTQINPLPIFEHPDGKGAVIIMKVLPASDNPKDYRKTVLHVELYLADMKRFRSEQKRGRLIFEAKFPMFTNKCLQKGQKRILPLISNSCNHGHDLGEFSSLCIVLPKETVSSTHIDPGVYMLLVDTCTVPYSTTILAFMFSGNTVMKTFTEDKMDVYVPVSPKQPKQPKCGLVLLLHGHGALYVHVKLQYGCVGGASNTTLINHFYDTHKGMICPLSNCKVKSKGNGVDQFCSVDWIHSKDEQVEAHIEVRLDICNAPRYSIWWNIHVNDHVHDEQSLFPFAEHEVLNPGMKKDLHLGLPKKMHDPVSKIDGYMYLDWGTVSIFTSGSDKLLYVSVLRSFNNITNPLFRTEYWLDDIDKEKVLQKCPSKDTSLKNGLTLTGIGLVVFIVIVVILYRRRARQRRSKGAGLPYKIHLAEELTQDLDMEDDDVQ